MISKSNKKFLREIHSLQCYAQDHTTFMSKIVKRYGEVIIIKKGEGVPQETSDLVHDYVFFCYAKATRSMFAVDLLLTDGLFEDAKIILRSVYECYINASFALQNPNRIDELIQLKVGEYFGTYTHPTNRHGKPIHKKLIDPVTNNIIAFDVSIAKMAENTGNEWDAKVHPRLYRFLSEFTHVHMIASGSYRNKSEDWYSTAPDLSSAYYSLVLVAYVSWLTLESALSYILSKGFSEKTIQKHLRKNGRILTRRFSSIDFQYELDPLKDFIINRLKTT